MPAIQLPTNSNPGRYGADGNARLINAQPEERGTEGKAIFGLYASDGLKPFATLTGGGATRGFQVAGNSLYTVSGQLVFKVDEGGGNEAIGAFTGQGKVWMEVNQRQPFQICMASTGQRAIIENDTVSPITDTDLQPPNSVSFLNQRFVHTIDNGRFQWSELNQGFDYNSLDFATAEYAADGLVGGAVRGTEFLAFGSETIEPWYNPAAGNNAFARSGSVIQRGCKNGDTIEKIAGVPIFVADDNTVRVIEGYTARKVSNGAVERAIRNTASPASLEAFSYERGNHSYYVLSGVDFTWQHDFTSGSWIERKSYALSRWRARCAVSFAGETIVGDRLTNQLHEVDENTYDEAGEPLVMTVWIPLNAFPQRLQLDQLRIDTIPGRGTYTEDPILMMRLSTDGGETFGNERRIPMGKAGEYFKQVRANRLGTSKEDGFIISLSSSADVVRAFMAAHGEWQILNA